LRLNPVVVGAPVDDALLDGFGFEALGEGGVGEGGEFGVGGEAERDELAGGEVVDVFAVSGWEEGGETEAFFEADDAGLIFKSVVSGAAGDQDQDNGHDDVPQICVLPSGPSMNGDVDGEADVVFQGLWRGHGRVLVCELSAGPA
jgi:hypothetical protein